MGYIFWLILTLIFTVVEFVIPALVTVWFAVGAALTIFVSLICDDIKIEIVFFTIISILALLFLRPYAKKFISKNKENFNASAIDTDIIIDKIIDNDSEEKIYDVKYKGSIWTAISTENFEIGDKAKIKGFKGNKIIINR